MLPKIVNFEKIEDVIICSGIYEFNSTSKREGIDGGTKIAHHFKPAHEDWLTGYGKAARLSSGSRLTAWNRGNQGSGSELFNGNRIPVPAAIFRRT